MKSNHDGFNTIISLVILRMNKAETTSELSGNRIDVSKLVTTF
jgi:hypothetical protein